MTLNLEPNEVRFLLQILGDMPTKSGAFVLVQKIEVQFAREGQAQAQTNQPGSGE